MYVFFLWLFLGSRVTENQFLLHCLGDDYWCSQEFALQSDKEKIDDYNYAKGLWDFHDGEVPDAGPQVDNASQPLVIQPFGDHADFRIVYIRGTNTIIFDPCGIAITVAFNPATNKATNPLCAPEDWGHWVKYYLQYLPCWSNKVVGKSKWMNNTHAELGNRERRKMLRQLNGGKRMRMDRYVFNVVPRNIVMQLQWIDEGRLKHANSAVEHYN